MKTWICPECGYIMEVERLKFCPVCKTNEKDFIRLNEEKQEAFNNRGEIGVAKEADENMISDLKEIYVNECKEIALYLSMSKMAHKEGYEKISKIYKKIAYEEANHAVILTEVLGENLKYSTKENLTLVMGNEYEATQKKLKIAKKAKESGLDKIYNILNQMCLDEAKHGKIFSALLNEYFVDKKS